MDEKRHEDSCIKGLAVATGLLRELTKAELSPLETVIATAYLTKSVCKELKDVTQEDFAEILDMICDTSTRLYLNELKN
ncbi:MAG: hypothetical protein KBT34_08765 [Prevotella sp.]|nr:hypothetical protein [Candidatus Prevotella equi]